MILNVDFTEQNEVFEAVCDDSVRVFASGDDAQVALPTWKGGSY